MGWRQHVTLVGREGVQKMKDDDPASLPAIGPPVLARVKNSSEPKIATVNICGPIYTRWSMSRHLVASEF